MRWNILPCIGSFLCSTLKFIFCQYRFTQRRSGCTLFLCLAGPLQCRTVLAPSVYFLIDVYSESNIHSNSKQIQCLHLHTELLAISHWGKFTHYALAKHKQYVSFTYIVQLGLGIWGNQILIFLTKFLNIDFVTILWECLGAFTK